VPRLLSRRVPRTSETDGTRRTTFRLRTPGAGTGKQHKEAAMFGKRIKIFTLFGFEVRIDASWILIAVFLVWSLSEGFFPVYFPSLSAWTYWVMGIVGAVGLFLSIIFHEFCHSLVARHYGTPMKGITLFIFGGVAELGEEPRAPKVEFLMSLAGPLSSILLSGALYGALIIGERTGWPVEAVGILWYLSAINVFLAAFNLLPAFPLDGGRILRSALWAMKKDLRWATRISSAIGSGFGMFLIVVALLNIFSGNIVGSIWMFLIGMFLRKAAASSYQQLLLRRSLEGEPVRRFMNTRPVTVPASLSLQELVDDFVYQHHFKMFPVTDGERLTGCVRIRDVKNVPRDEWRNRTVGDIASRLCTENAISPDTDTMKALGLMRQTGESRLLVVDGGRLAGIVTLKDFLKFFAIRVELGE
jgi:Zn-dependent protease